MRTYFGVLLVALALRGSTMAQVVRVEIDAPVENEISPTIDATGSAIYAVSTANPFGANPGYRRQIFKWNPATGSGTQVTSYEEGVDWVSVSGDGTWLAFISNADLLGTNHDESPELYVMQSDGTGLAQLTSANLLPNPKLPGITKAVISGTANRVAFLGTIDPFGTNPALTKAAFVIDRNGSNLRQLAIDVGDVLDISDDGGKIIYEKADQLVGINANGSGNHTFTSTTEVGDASISGNGLKVVYALGGSVGYPLTLRARSFDGNPTTVAALGAGEKPSITDDGTVVYHRRQATPDGIYRINSTGGAATLVAAGLTFFKASGDGTRLVGRNTGLVALDNAGGSLQQLTSPTFTPVTLPPIDALSLDGNRAWYVGPPSENFGLKLYSLDFGSGVSTQLTATTLRDDNFQHYFTVSDAGDVVFFSYDDPTGQNACHRVQLFKLSAGGTITQLTSCQFAFIVSQVVQGSGGMVVFAAIEDQLFSYQLYRVDSNGGVSTPFKTLVNAAEQLAVSEGAPDAWVAYTAVTAGVDLYRIKTDGTGQQTIALGGCFSPSISADGNRIAFLGNGNYTGENGDGSYEAFLYDVTTQTLSQLTHDLHFSPFKARISRDGEWVFAGDRKISVTTKTAYPVSGFLHAPSSVTDVLPNATGSAWLFQGRDVIDRSASGTSFYRAQTAVAPKVEVGKAFPTAVTWDPSPDSIRYDVVRGSVESLAIAGSTVDLGPVVCLEDDSPDNHTRGFEDTAIPASGEAFFYLYRGSVGFDAATGSYGQGSGARERVAGAGGCNP